MLTVVETSVWVVMSVVVAVVVMRSVVGTRVTTVEIMVFVVYSVIVLLTVVVGPVTVS